MNDANKRIVRISLFVVLGLVLVAGVSYAWLTLTLNGTKTNVLKAGTLALTLNESEGISMDGAVPVLDEVGKTKTPYTFSLQNNGTVDSVYTIYLDDVALEAGETRLADSVLKYQLTVNDIAYTPAIISTTENNGTRSLVLTTGAVAPGKTFNYELRLWIDSAATNDISGKVYRGKVRIEAAQTKTAPASCFTMEGTKITAYTCGLTSAKYYSDIIIPGTVTEIGANAFKNMQLVNVTIPSSVTTIAAGAFSDNMISVVTLPASVMTLGDDAFANNRLLSVTIQGKADSTAFTSYPGTTPFGWATGYSDTNITWGA